jgi:hypothetical protein
MGYFCPDCGYEDQITKLIKERDEAQVNFKAEKERADTNAAGFWKAQQQLTDARSSTHCSQILPWPDRDGLWWLRDRWGMSIAESFQPKDHDDESPWAVQCHVGDSAPQGPFMPRDFDNSEFIWLGESFPSSNKQ